jgi:nuclear pore complex protein Nup160
MAAMGPFYAYKETRLNLDPATQGSTISIHLPSHGASTRSSKQAQKRSSDAEIPIAEDEGQYRQKTTNHLEASFGGYWRMEKCCRFEL